MTKCFDLPSDVFKGMFEFCKESAEELFDKSPPIYRVPGLFQNNATGYFFADYNALVMTTDPQEIGRIIRNNDVEKALDKIKRLP